MDDLAYRKVSNCIYQPGRLASATAIWFSAVSLLGKRLMHQAIAVSQALAYEYTASRDNAKLNFKGAGCGVWV
jgi:hypothetical protein